MPVTEPSVDLLLQNARVIDPETGLDALRDITIADGTITAVLPSGNVTVKADEALDLRGYVVAPGFIDLHSHAQTLNGLRFQALDGVTTSLDLEAGALPVGPTYSAAASEGRPINYGYSANWVLARLAELDGVELLAPDGSVQVAGLGAAESHPAATAWKQATDRTGAAQIVRRLEEAIAAGAIGIGVLAGYAPQAGRIEMFMLAEAASRMGVPLFVHGRYYATEDPESSTEGMLELIGLAGATGAAIHLCHTNATYAKGGEHVFEAIARAQQQGLRISVEAYPYHASSTSIGAVFLSPEGLARRGLEPHHIRYLPTGERIADESRLHQLREENHSALCVIDLLDARDARETELLHRALTFPGGAIASDAVPAQIAGRTQGADLETQWPLPADAIAHPRSAGCFSRLLGKVSREMKLLSLPEAIRRCTLTPARILEEAVPSMRRKGRLQAGCDADLVIFDPATITDRATFEDLQPSQGVMHLLVAGEFVVRDSLLQQEVLPGKGMTSSSV